MISSFSSDKERVGSPGIDGGWLKAGSSNGAEYTKGGWFRKMGHGSGVLSLKKT